MVAEVEVLAVEAGEGEEAMEVDGEGVKVDGEDVMVEDETLNKSLTPRRVSVEHDQGLQPILAKCYWFL